MEADEKPKDNVTAIETKVTSAEYVDQESSTEIGQFSSRPKTFLEELKPWSYTSDTSFVRAILRPFPFLLSPAVWFTFFACTLSLSHFIKEPHTHMRYDRRVHDCVSHLSTYLVIFDKIFSQMASRLVAKVSHI